MAGEVSLGQWAVVSFCLNTQVVALIIGGWLARLRGPMPPVVQPTPSQGLPLAKRRNFAEISAVFELTGCSAISLSNPSSKVMGSRPRAKKRSLSTFSSFSGFLAWVVDVRNLGAGHPSDHFRQIADAIGFRHLVQDVHALARLWWVFNRQLMQRTVS